MMRMSTMLKMIHAIAIRGARSAITQAVMLRRFSRSMKSNDEFGMSGSRID